MNRRILTDYENTLYNAERLHMLQHPGVCQLFILACIIADSFTLFSVIDLLLTQRKGITLIITITVAAAMNIAPMLLAACLRNDELSKYMKKVLCTLLAGLFAMLFAVTFSLRLASQDQMYSSVSNLGIELQTSSVQQAEIEEEEFRPTAAQNILSVILGIEPLATSVCSFVLAYEASPKRKHRHLLNLYNIRLEEEIDRDKVMIQELKADMLYDLDEYDRNQFEEQEAIIRQQGEIAKNEAIRILAEYDGTPEGISYLMEGDYLKHQKDAESEDSTSEILSDVVILNDIKTIA